MKEDFLNRKLGERIADQALRELRLPQGRIDFFSNDYLGLAQLPVAGEQRSHGATGSRLLSGNSALVMEVEAEIAAFHNAPAALIFNSGYDANLGLLSCIPQKGDTVIYDQLSHSSIRDGIRLGFANAFPFLHSDPDDLERRLSAATGNIFVVTESVFSMDGDVAPLAEIVARCSRYNANLVVDEAHALGVLGTRGEGLAQMLGLDAQCFARVYTYGKAAGAHGAAVVGSTTLKQYLVNFCRALIYTTALPDQAISAIRQAYELFPAMNAERTFLSGLVQRFNGMPSRFKQLTGHTPIRGVLIPGNDAVKQVAASIQEQGFDVRAILYPTVPKNSERLRIVLHSFNSEEELDALMRLLR